MGWMDHHAEFYYKNGDINRKAECDAIMKELYSKEYRLVKSRMEGSVYYAAVRSLWSARLGPDCEVIYEPVHEKDQKVSAIVIVTGINKKRHDNFFYKVIPESYMPFKYRCPESILDLLDETGDGPCNEWRQRCWSFNRNKKELSSLKDGARIRVREETSEAVYEKETGLFRYPVWMDRSKNVYMTEPRVAETDYEIIPGGKVCLR